MIDFRQFCSGPAAWAWFKLYIPKGQGHFVKSRKSIDLYFHSQGFNFELQTAINDMPENFIQ